MANHRRRSSRTDESDISNSSHTTSDLPLDSIVDQETAARIFDRYVAEMAQHLPAVMFESGTTANEIRSKRPILFLAILDTASVGMLDMDMQLRLNEMLLDVYANSILRNGEKSLDLIQALMVSTIWYRPPKRYEQMNVYMLTHISALMALDFGMGRKLNASRSARVATNVGQAQTPKSFLRSDSVEARRTWLGCYFVCMKYVLPRSCFADSIANVLPACHSLCDDRISSGGTTISMNVLKFWSRHLRRYPLTSVSASMSN